MLIEEMMLKDMRSSRCHYRCSPCCHTKATKKTLLPVASSGQNFPLKPCLRTLEKLKVISKWPLRIAKNQKITRKPKPGSMIAASSVAGTLEVVRLIRRRCAAAHEPKIPWLHVLSLAMAVEEEMQMWNFQATVEGATIQSVANISIALIHSLVVAILARKSADFNQRTATITAITIPLTCRQKKNHNPNS